MNTSMECSMEDLGSEKILAVRSRGAMHVLMKKPCQDAQRYTSFTFNGRKVIIACVADGHGSDKYDRSEYGARFAVDIAVDVLKDFYEKNPSRSEFYGDIKKYFPEIFIRKWRDYVLEDMKTFDVDFYEKNGNNHYEIYKRYGSTLLFSVYCEKVIYIGQLGDGNIFVFHENGKVDCPIVSESPTVGDATNSLSQKNSVNIWEFGILTISDPVMLVLATDGLAKSYEEETEMYKFCNGLYKNIRDYGISKMAELLPKWVEEISRDGSGDDITILTILVNQPVSSETEVLADRHQVNDFSMERANHHSKENGE